ncbi:MAG TPA: hypothetical protein VF460_14830 [Burkholderiales bacterium]
MALSTSSNPHASRQRLDAIRDKLHAADSMLDHGLMAIHNGSRLDAMETVYAASCLIAEITAALEGPATTVETRTSC